MALGQISYVLQRWLWLILIGTLLVTGMAYFISRSLTPIYAASSTLLVDIGLPEPGLEANLQAFSERSAKTYAQLLKAPSILDEVASTLGLNLPKQELANKIAVLPVTDTSLLRIIVADTDPARAQAIANTSANVFAKQTEQRRVARFQDAISSARQEIATIDDQLKTAQARIDSYVSPSDPSGLNLPPAARTELNSLYVQKSSLESQRLSLLRSIEDYRKSVASYTNNIVVSAYADLPASPISPRTLMNTVLAFILGVLFSVALAFGLELLDDTFKTPEQIGQSLGVAPLGAIATFAGKDTSREARLIVASDPRAPISEAYRALRTNLQFSTVDKPLKSLMVTSANPQEGKSVTLANLAVAMAQTGNTVIAVDSDLRRPSLHKIFGITENPGLSNLLLQDHPDLDSCIHDTGIQNLKVITCGTRPPNPSEMLGSDRMKRLIQQLKDRADVLLFDTPPLGAVTDAAVLARQIDGVLLVLEPGKTKRQTIRKAVDDLKRVGATILGVALNKLAPGRGGGYYYYHYYYYHTYYTPEGERKQRKERRRRRSRTGGPLRRFWRRLTGRRSTVLQTASTPSPQNTGAQNTQDAQ